MGPPARAVYRTHVCKHAFQKNISWQDSGYPCCRHIWFSLFSKIFGVLKSLRPIRLPVPHRKTDGHRRLPFRHLRATTVLLAVLWCLWWLSPSTSSSHNLRQSRRLAVCWPLEGAYSQSVTSKTETHFLYAYAWKVLRHHFGHGRNLSFPKHSKLRFSCPR